MSKVKPTEFVLEHAPWSPSKLKEAIECPHKFYLHYVVKSAKKKESGAMLIGNTVHKAIEYYFMMGHSLEKCFRLAVMDKDILMTNEIDEVNSFIPEVKKFIRTLEHNKKQFNATEPVIESSLSMDIDGNPVSFFSNKGFIRGKVDLYMLINGRPDAIIIDHKTGKWHELDYYDIQFNYYLLLLKAKIPALERIQVAANHLRTGDLDFAPAPNNVSDLNSLLEKQIMYLNESTKETMNFDLVRTGPLCNWCDYQSGCPAYADGANVKETATEERTNT